MIKERSDIFFVSGQPIRFAAIDEGQGKCAMFCIQAPFLGIHVDEVDNLRDAGARHDVLRHRRTGNDNAIKPLHRELPAD